MRALIVAALLTISACSQPPAAPTPPQAPAEAPAPEAARDAALTALAPVIAAEVGQDVSLAPTTVTIQDEWAYIVAAPRQPDGAALDWSKTALASRAANGVLGDDGMTHALLKLENGAWRVVAHVVGPTDVAWLTWPAEHGAPAALLGLPDAQAETPAQN